MKCSIPTATLLSILATTATAFAPLQSASTAPTTTTSTSTAAFWRRWIPEPDHRDLVIDAQTWEAQPQAADENVQSQAKQLFLSSMLAMALTTATVLPAVAVSGGGLDYAGIDISGQDFSTSNSYKGKDFTQVIAKGTSFANSNLQGCRFYKAYLVNTNFEGADLRGVSLEDTSMDGANMKNAIAVGSYFSKSILDVASVENADFTDAQFPPKAQGLLCQRDDLKGTNPTTGADTRESAMCP